MGKSSLPAVVLLAGALACWTAGSIHAQPPQPRPPKTPVKLVFIHHSCGENWLSDADGGLARELARNNYFVSDTNYGWGPGGIGDRTDIPNWREWFVGSRSPRYLTALYHERGKHAPYARPLADPGGQNQIVMFKSCFPNSNLGGRPHDPPARGSGLTVGSAKAVYRDLLAYFATRPDKLFVVITAPPVQDPAHAANARALNTWLVRDWLADYRGSNVAVFDLYNVLTGPDQHHRIRNGRIEHVANPRQNTLHYPTGDDHPSRAGNRKATAEFVPLLNCFCNRWLATLPRVRPQPRPAVEIVVPAVPVVPVPQPRPQVAVVIVPPGPPPAAPAGPRPRRRIEDFDRDADGWQAFFDHATDTCLELHRDTDRRHNGAASLRIDYDVAPGSWGTCSLIHDEPRDWSGLRGISLFVHAQRVGQPAAVIVYGGRSPDDLLHYEYHFRASQAAVDGWQRVVIPWDRLRPPEWQATAGNRLDTRSVMGVALGFHAPEDGRHAGRLWIDDVELR